MASSVEPRRPNIASADVQLPGVTDYEQVDNEIIATLSPTKGWFGALAVAIALFLMGAAAWIYQIYWGLGNAGYRSNPQSATLGDIRTVISAEAAYQSANAGYFDTLLRKDYMLRWHGDADGEPSSFFLIEDKDWQVFGLDTSWNLPSLGSAVFGKPTLKDYGGQNGVLTQAQATWMARVRNKAKGCILLTHHQPSSSRTVESQHADEAVAMLKAAGVYSQIDAWIWGHEHRCVVFKPKAARKTARLKDAPGFCACLGHGGVPVTKKNLAVESRIADVLWEEDRLDADAPMYEGQRVVPFGFATIDTKPGEFDFAVFDHAGKQRFSCTVPRDPTKAAPPTPPAVSRRKPATRKATAKRGK